MTGFSTTHQWRRLWSDGLLAGVQYLQASCHSASAGMANLARQAGPACRLLSEYGIEDILGA